MTDVAQFLKFAVLHDSHLVLIVLRALPAELVVQLSHLVLGVETLLRDVLKFTIKLKVTLGDGGIVISLLILDLLVLRLHNVDL